MDDGVGWRLSEQNALTRNSGPLSAHGTASRCSVSGADVMQRLTWHTLC